MLTRARSFLGEGRHGFLADRGTRSRGEKEKVVREKGAEAVEFLFQCTYRFP